MKRQSIGFPSGKIIGKLEKMKYSEPKTVSTRNIICYFEKVKYWEGKTLYLCFG